MKASAPPLLLCLLLSGFSLPGLARADEVTDGMKAAYEAYTSRELSTATEKLREVLKLLEDKSAELMKKTVLPDRIDKWAGETVEDENLAGIGGGVSLQRVYKQGKKAARVKIVKDSPLVNGLMKILANDEILELAGAHTERISGHTAVVGEKPLKLSVVVEGRVLVEVTPANEDTDEQDLISFARKFDFRTLEKLSQ